MGTSAGIRLPVRLMVQAVVVGALLIGFAAPAVAAPARSAKPGHGGGGGGGGGGGSTTTGFDVSYPQCGASLPKPTAFGIVGVNGGLANNLNPCLGPSSSYRSYSQSELYWAAANAVGSTSQPKVSLYVNTADPGNMNNGQPIADWPTSSNSSDPYTPACSTTTVTSAGHNYTVGQNSDACAWQYGYNRAQQDAAWLTSEADQINGQSPPVTVADTPASYPWWLDVETGNSWQTDTTMNVADLQGMIAGLQARGVPSAGVGAYSTPYQWNSITGGTTTSAGSLYPLPDWIPGATTQAQAQSNCSLPSFTGGRVLVTQWTGTYDNDNPC